MQPRSLPSGEEGDSEEGCRSKRIRIFNPDAQQLVLAAVDQGTSISSIPHDALRIVLAFLDGVSCHAARLVCRRFRRCLSVKLLCPWDLLCESAAKSGYIQLLEWASASGAPLRGSMAALSANVASQGHLEVLKSLNLRGDLCIPKYLHQAGLAGPALACEYAAAGGHAHVMSWLHEQGYRCGDYCPNNATDAGQLASLKWLQAQGILRDLSSWAMSAARAGHVLVLNWLKEEEGFPFDRPTYVKAAGESPKGRAALMWLFEHGCPWHPSAVIDDIAVLVQLQERGYSWNKETFESAAMLGYLDVLKWLRPICMQEWLRSERCCDPLDNSACSAAAASGGHQHVLEWLKEEGCLVLEEAYKAAWGRSNVLLLQWLCKNGHAWDGTVCTLAAQHKQYNVLKWAEEQGLPFDKFTCLCIACSQGDLDAASWLHNHGAVLSERCPTAASSSGNVELLAWLHDHGCPWVERLCIKAAINGGHLCVLSWMLKQGCKFNDLRYTKLATAARSPSILNWLRSQGCPWKLRGCVKNCIKRGSCATLRWFGSEQTMVVKNACAIAASYGRLDVVQLLHEFGHPLREDVTEAAVAYALDSDNERADLAPSLEAIVWLHRRGSAFNVKHLKELLDDIVDDSTTCVVNVLRALGMQELADWPPAEND